MHRHIERNLRFGWLMMLAGTVVMVIAGKDLFDLWLGEGHFIGYPILLAFLFTETLEAQAFIIGTSSRATGDEAFAWSSLAGGVLKLGLSITLARDLGLFGVALGTVIALILTNHWYVPWKGLARIEYSRLAVLTRTIVPALTWFGLTALLLLLLRLILADSGPFWRVLSMGALSAVSLAAALWSLTLSASQRQRVLAKCRRPHSRS